MEEEKGLNKLAKILTEPVNKLIDTVSAALGKWYEPIHKKRMAKAGAYEIDEVSEALRRNADVIAVYNNTEVRAQLPEDMQQLIERAQLRNISQEIKKQDNIEKVVDKASEFLEAETEVSEEPVDTDWITRFFNCVGEVSNEKMQTIWAHILADEVKQPGSFSLRTLDTVRNVSRNEAEIFQKIVKLVVTDINKSNCFISSNLSLLKKYNVTYDEIIKLQDCGLLRYNENMNLDMKLDRKTNALLLNMGRALLFGYSGNDTISILIGGFALTKSGEELYKILVNMSDNNYLYDFAELIYNGNKNKSITIRLEGYVKNDNQFKFGPAIKIWG